MTTTDRTRLDGYFRRVVERFPSRAAAASLVITHLLPERPAFLDALTQLARVAAVLPKPKSQVPEVVDEVRRRYRVNQLSRDQFADPGLALDYLESTVPGEDLVLLDIGGYFAPSLDVLAGKFSGRILGVVEDTENGHQRYQSLATLPCPVYSVARSPLKECEDHLVGHSVVFSTEALLRAHGSVLTNRNACVIGYGKIGRSIARALHHRNVRVTVYDNDPVKRVQAHAHGFRVSARCSDALRGADLVMCATGNLALRQADFGALHDGAYVASVTSSDDELELASLEGAYRRTSLPHGTTRFAMADHHFDVLNDGNAVNFLHGAEVGSYIHLVQAEILAAVSLIAAEQPPGLHEVSAEARHTIASSWLDHFSR
jgi:adenosylhomocysteinase